MLLLIKLQFLSIINIFTLSYLEMSLPPLCNKSKRLPFYRYSVTIQRLGGFVTTPIINTILGCLNFAKVIN